MIKTNITGIGDPFVLVDGGYYYMYATSCDHGFLVWRSKDMSNWEKMPLCYDAAALGDRAFGYECFWAPEVVKSNGKFIMHYSARWKKNASLRIGVAVADSPLGPFVDVRPGEPMFDFGYAAIDGSCFIDDDGEAYLYYARDCSENIRDGVHISELCVVRLSHDLLSAVGEPVCIATPDQDWEKHDGEWHWNEGPYVVKQDGKYVLVYSGNAFFSAQYGLGFATADRPLGAFAKSSHNPVLSTQNDLAGPGHAQLFRDLSGRTKAAFHIQTDAHNTGADRRACICDVQFKNARPYFLV